MNKLSSDDAITFIADNTQDIRAALSYLDQQQLFSLFNSVKKAKDDHLRNMPANQLADEIIEFNGSVVELIFLLELYEEKAPGQFIGPSSESGIFIRESE